MTASHHPYIVRIFDNLRAFVDGTRGLNDGVYMGLNDGVYMGIGFVLGILFTLAFVCACKKGKKKPDDEFV